MSIEHHQHAAPAGAHSKHTSWAWQAFRFGGALLILTCLLASLADPYAAHPKTVAKSKQRGHHHLKARRDIVRKIANNSTRAFDAIDLVLPQFPTLHTQLDSSQVVVLYFGASWCKSSASVATKMDQLLGPRLETPKSKSSSNNNEQDRKPLSVVYVSSDNNKLQFRNYIRNRFWSKVPYHSKESGRLKKYFKVCAKSELERLQFERKHDLPYIVVLSGETHKVVSRNGVQELKKYGPGVVEYWTTLVRGKTAYSK